MDRNSHFDTFCQGVGVTGKAHTLHPHPKLPMLASHLKTAHTLIGSEMTCGGMRGTLRSS